VRGREEDLHEGSSVSQGLQDDPEENRDPNVGKGQSDGGGQDDSHEIGIHREEALRYSHRGRMKKRRAREGGELTLPKVVPMVHQPPTPHKKSISFKKEMT
jgi:hypothetical protein